MGSGGLTHSKKRAGEDTASIAGILVCHSDTNAVFVWFSVVNSYRELTAIPSKMADDEHYHSPAFQPGDLNKKGCLIDAY